MIPLKPDIFVLLPILIFFELLETGWPLQLKDLDSGAVYLKERALPGMLTLHGGVLKFTCEFKALCNKIPDGDPTCMPAVCIMNGRTLTEIHLVKIVPDVTRDGTITKEIEISPTAKNWEMDFKTSWKGKWLTIHATVKKFNISKAGTYLCYDGDAATKGFDGLFQAQLLMASKMRVFDQVVHEHTAKLMEIKTVSIKPGFSVNISCLFRGTPGVFCYQWWKQCPGEENPLTFTHIDFEDRNNYMEFDEEKAYQFQVEKESIAFNMLPKYNGCNISCNLIEYKTKENKAVILNVSNTVHLTLDYTPVDDVRYSRKSAGVFYLVVITGVNLTLSVAMVAAAMFVYYKKGLFSTDYEAEQTKDEFVDDFAAVVGRNVREID